MFIDYTGATVGRLKVLACVGKDGKQRLWKCLCSCGTTKIIASKNLSRARSCGCLARERAAEKCKSRAVPFKDRIKVLPDGCHEWTGYKDKDGYGTLRVNGKDYKAHRYACIQKYGEIPSGQLICHRCDNPSCCNPEHMFLGTIQDNNSDRDKKGRQAKGAKNGSAKLTEHNVRQIRRLSAEGYSQTRLAEIFGVKQTTISVIVLRKQWKHIQ